MTERSGYLSQVIAGLAGKEGNAERITGETLVITRKMVLGRISQLGASGGPVFKIRRRRTGEFIKAPGRGSPDLEFTSIVAADNFIAEEDLDTDRITVPMVTRRDGVDSEELAMLRTLDGEAIDYADDWMPGQPLYNEKYFDGAWVRKEIEERLDLPPDGSNWNAWPLFLIDEPNAIATALSCEYRIIDFDGRAFYYKLVLA